MVVESSASDGLACLLSIAVLIGKHSEEGENSNPDKYCDSNKSRLCLVVVLVTGHIAVFDVCPDLVHCFRLIGFVTAVPLVRGRHGHLSHRLKPVIPTCKLSLKNVCASSVFVNKADGVQVAAYGIHRAPEAGELAIIIEPLPVLIHVAVQRASFWGGVTEDTLGDPRRLHVQRGDTCGAGSDHSLGDAVISLEVEDCACVGKLSTVCAFEVASLLELASSVPGLHNGLHSLVVTEGDCTAGTKLGCDFPCAVNLFLIIV